MQNKSIKPDLQLLVHKFSDYYPQFMMYDAREIDYPVYRTKVTYTVAKDQKLHPVVLSVLKIIKYLETLNDVDVYQQLKQITQLDDKILDNILADITTKGYLKQGDSIQLSKNGLEILKNEKEKVTELMCSYINFDGIYGSPLSDDGKFNPDDKKAREGAIEFKPYVKIRPRIESLDEEFADNKTLRQVLIENLQSEEYDIIDIQQVDPNKYFNKYFCLFYKDREENEKLLVIGKDYELDSETTELFDRLSNEQKFNDNISNNCIESLHENKELFEQATSEIVEEKIKPVEKIDITEGKTIEVDEHKKYFIYILENAKQSIYIQSPWVNWRTLQLYKDYIEAAVNRGVKVTIKYGLKPRNRFDKIGIDEESKRFFNSLDKSLFFLIKGDDHSKIVICDNEFMIMGSFNWLSFGGGNEPNARGETSSIIKNEAEIKKQIAKFQ
jgi:hypothetical protein